MVLDGKFASMPALLTWTTAIGSAALAAVFLFGYLIKKRRQFVIARKALHGKVVLITGASSGLGEACAHAFYAAGCRVILCSRRTTELERVKQELQKQSLATTTFEPKVLTLDLANLPAIPEAMERAVAFHGRIDILINNGGVSSRGAIEDTKMSVDQAVMNINYFGQVAVTKGLLRQMIERRSGHVVAVSSIQGKLSLPFRSSYSASKHALQSFFDSLRAEVAQHQVAVTVVSPGYIQTNLSLAAMNADGTSHGVMDDTQARGMSADYVAHRILTAIISRENEVLVAPLVHRIAVYLRNILPDLYFQIMLARANKQHKENSKNH